MRTDELNVQKKEEPSTMNPLLSQIRTLQDKVNAVNEERERERAALERHTFPVRREFRVPEVCFATILDCRTIHGIRWCTSGHVSENPPVPERISPSLPGIAVRHG